MSRKTASLMIGLSLLTVIAAQPAVSAIAPVQCAVAADQASDKIDINEVKPGDATPYDYIVRLSMSDYANMTNFAFMKNAVKPALDKFATAGFQMATRTRLKNALNGASPKVHQQAIAAVSGNEESIYKIADAIRAQGKNVTNTTLPTLIMAAAKSAGVQCDAFHLSTFLELASGGGVQIVMDPTNPSFSQLNVGYETGAGAKDPQSGRTFIENGSGPDDISDKNLLLETQAVGSKADFNFNRFVTAMLNVIVKNDASGVKQLPSDERALINDFFGVYTAESDRNLMVNLKQFNWEQAEFKGVIQVLFASKLKIFKSMYEGQWSATVPQQQPGGQPKTKTRPADGSDYWQFSNSADPKSANRSGINESHGDMDLADKMQGQYLQSLHSVVSNSIGQLLANAGSKSTGGIIDQFMSAMIRLDAPDSFGNADQIVEGMANYLTAIHDDMSDIDTFLTSKVGADVAKPKPPMPAATFTPKAKTTKAS